MSESLVEVMREVGIAVYGGGDPYHRLRLAKNTSRLGTPLRRAYETLLKQNVDYLRSAADKLI